MTESLASLFKIALEDGQDGESCQA